MFKMKKKNGVKERWNKKGKIIIRKSMGIHYIILANSSSFENFCSKSYFKKTLDSFLQRHLTLKQEKSALLKIEKTATNSEFFTLFQESPWNVFEEPGIRKTVAFNSFSWWTASTTGSKMTLPIPVWLFPNLSALVLAAACKIWFYDQGLNSDPCIRSTKP